MKVAILGGGFTGLAAAVQLQKKGYEVTLFERENALGGLAAGFYSEGWEWPLERAYHHLFTNDRDILDFAHEIRFDDFIYKSPQTASLYKVGNDYRIFPVDTPQEFLNFPLLSWPAKLRTAAVAAFFKLTPMFPIYEKTTAADFLKKYSGEEGWRVFWEPLLRKKFGKYAEKVLASFIWTRINKRTKDLVYIKGGFQTFINYLEKYNKQRGVNILTGHQVGNIERTGNSFKIAYKNLDQTESKETFFDVVISTLPTVIMSKITQNLFPQIYLKKFESLEYMFAVNLILETEKPLLEKTYWLSCCVPEFPFLVALQHTNFIDKSHYGNRNILYVGNYIDADNKLLKMNKEETIDYLVPDLKKIAINPITITKAFHFKAGFAQPIFDATFVKNKPDFETPIKNFYIANLDMTYPYDRGTNYAVKLGKQVASMI